MEAASDRLAGSLRAVHWLGAALILVGYLTSGGMEHGAVVAGSWHVLSGLGLLLLVLPRFWLHWRHRGQLRSAQPGLVLPFTTWSIASPFAGGVGEWAAELHEMVGSVFYFIIAMHAVAALWHHVARRDRVLRRMF